MRKLSLPTAFGRVIRRLREDAGYSQMEFAAAAKISRTYAGELERGEKSISLDIVERVAQALGISYAELFRNIDDEIARR